MWDWIGKLHELTLQRATYALVTVIGVKGSTPRGPGAKMIVLPDGTFFGSVGGGQLEAAVLRDAQACLASALAAPRTYPLCFRTGQCCGGAADIFIEVFGIRPQLYIFGAGHVGQAICKVMEETPFVVHLVDQRVNWLEHEGLPASVTKHADDWRSVVAGVPWRSDDSYALVLTHDHQIDLDIVAELAAQPLRFLGLIGSHAKWERFQRMLPSMGVNPEALARIVCPIGLGGWGKAPREIAISVAAQLLKVHYGD